MASQFQSIASYDHPSIQHPVLQAVISVSLPMSVEVGAGVRNLLATSQRAPLTWQPMEASSNSFHHLDIQFNEERKISPQALVVCGWQAEVALHHGLGSCLSLGRVSHSLKKMVSEWVQCAVKCAVQWAVQCALQCNTLTITITTVTAIVNYLLPSGSVKCCHRGLDRFLPVILVIQLVI